VATHDPALEARLGRLTIKLVDGKVAELTENETLLGSLSDLDGRLTLTVDDLTALRGTYEVVGLSQDERGIFVSLLNADRQKVLVRVKEGEALTSGLTLKTLIYLTTKI
jgi:hypothetical protein